MSRWLRRLIGGFLFLLSPGLAVTFFSFTPYLPPHAQPRPQTAELLFMLAAGVASSIIASGVVAGIVLLFRAEIKKTIGDLLGYDNAPAELSGLLTQSIRLEHKLSTFNVAMQRTINQKLGQTHADEINSIQRDMNQLHNSLVETHSRIKQRVDDKQALSGPPGLRNLPKEVRQ